MGRPLLHITDFDVVVRAADPFIVKGEAMWAEHTCESPHHQWTIGNETYAAALDDADEALGRCYGDPTPIAWDLEWYGTEPVEPMSATDPGSAGYHQHGVVHGTIEILGEPPVELAEIAAHRWHRWTEEPSVTLEPMRLPAVVAHTGVRAPFRFPDGSVIDWVLTSHGWRERAVPDRGEASGQKSAPTP